MKDLKNEIKQFLRELPQERFIEIYNSHLCSLESKIYLNNNDFFETFKYTYIETLKKAFEGNYNPHEMFVKLNKKNNFESTSKLIDDNWINYDDLTKLIINNLGLDKDLKEFNIKEIIEKIK
jgi:hypothetical protein